MPISRTCEQTAAAQAPSRFRCATVDPQLQQHREQPQRTQHTVGLPPIRPRKYTSLSDRTESWRGSGSPSNQTTQGCRRLSSDSQQHDSVSAAHHDSQSDSIESGGSRSSCAVATPTTQKAPRTLSIMELVNKAAQREEQEEADLARRRAALLMAGKSITKLHGAAPSCSNGAACSSPRIPRSPVSVRAFRPLTPLHTAVSVSSPASGAASPRAVAAASPKAAVAAAHSCCTRSDVLCSVHDVSKHQQQHVVLCQAVGSDCSSEDSAYGTLSMTSSASSSSLCSAASLISDLSTTSSNGKPKSILLLRTSTGSSCSSGSSPTFKRVTWKDGQADQESVGRELVAVVMLEDSPEIRQLRKDTWPERPGARRDAAKAMDKQHQQQQQQPQSGLVGKLLQEPARLRDWRDKLKQLQTERRQHRVAQVQAVWGQQESNMTKQDNNNGSTGQQHLDQQQQEADATAAVEVARPAADSTTTAAAAVACCSTAGISVVTVVSEIEAAG